VRWLLYVAACIAGLLLALLGSEPLLGPLIAALALYPLATGLIVRADGGPGEPRTAALGPAVAAGLAGTLLIVVLIRLAVDAPSWVDPTSADCGGLSTSVQAAFAWLAAAVFVLAAIPEAVTVTAVGRRLRNAAGPSLPVSLSFFPIAVAFSGLALIVVSFVTNC
jgi:hypothetical protein